MQCVIGSDVRDPCCRGSHDSVWFVFFFPCLIQAVYDIGDVARRTQDHNTSPIICCLLAAAMMEHLSSVLCQQLSATPGVPTGDYTWATAAHNSFHDRREHADVDGFCVCKSIQEILVLICQHKCQLRHAYLLFTLIHPGRRLNSFRLP